MALWKSSTVHPTSLLSFNKGQVQRADEPVSKGHSQLKAHISQIGIMTHCWGKGPQCLVSSTTNFKAFN